MKKSILLALVALLAAPMVEAYGEKSEAGTSTETKKIVSKCGCKTRERKTCTKRTCPKKERKCERCHFMSRCKSCEERQKERERKSMTNVENDDYYDMDTEEINAE